MSSPKAAELDALFQPLVVSPQFKLPNRVIVASTTRNRAVSPLSDPPFKRDGFNLDSIFPTANKFMVDFYTARAKGGAGLILTEGILISRQGTEWENAPGLWNDAQIAGWKEVVDAVSTVLFVSRH